MSIAASIPAEHADAANNELAWAGACFSVKLVDNTDVDSPTHYGFHSFNDYWFLQAVQDLEYPGLEITQTESHGVIFQDHLNTNGLHRLPAPEGADA